MKRRESFQMFAQMLRKDLASYWKEYPGKFSDTLCLFFTEIVIFSFFMPKMGLQANYGTFILIGTIGSFGLFDIVSKVSEMISDIEGDRVISYTLTFPAFSGAIFCYIAIYWAINAFFLTLPLFFLGKIMLYHQFDLTAISYLRLIPMYITINLFFGFFSLWLTAMIRGIGGLSGLFLKVINPIFMFGAFFYPWKVAYEVSPIIGYIVLVNPMIYVMEGMRAASLGQEGFLPFWISFLAMWPFIIGCGFYGIKRLKKRLDCV